MLRYLTGGESHGKGMLVMLDGMPSGLILNEDVINSELHRRMLGHGRGKRMAIEKDHVEVLSGVRKSVTIGSPITLLVKNVDHAIDTMPGVTDPRPGHADLAGALKYDTKDVRNILERASARETAARVSAGGVAKLFLAEFGIKVASHVTLIGRAEARVKGLGFNQIVTVAERSPVRSADPAASRAMCRAIDEAARAGDTLGGIFEVIAHGVPPGLGNSTQWDRRLDARIALAIMSVQAVKGVSFGAGFALAVRRGSLAHDEIFYSKKTGFYRKTNFSGGIEGGVTNGEDIVIQAAMKPISTLRKPLASVNIKTKEAVKATVERSDVCAVPAAGVVGESVVALEIVNAMLEKFGGDSMKEIRRNFEGYLSQLEKF